MAFKSSKFSMPSYSGSGLTSPRDYCDMWLGKFVSAFTTASSSWSQEGEIETVGADHTGYGARSVLLKSSDNNKYVRIWIFAISATYQISARINTSTGTNTGYTSLYIYKGNINSIRSSEYSPGNRCEVYFGVSSKSIDVDFAQDLELDCSIFGLWNNKSSNGFSDSGGEFCYRDDGIYRYGATQTVITDGKMFGIITFFEGYRCGCFYADDMYICANSGDKKTAGIVSCNTRSTHFNTANPGSSPVNKLTFIFNQASGGRDFRQMEIDAANNKQYAYSTYASTKLVTAPITVWVFPMTWSGSSMDAVVDGICMKGWVNPEYIRCVNDTNLPSGSVGLKYVSGRWLCIDAGTLICWDDSNSSPFEAA